MLDKYRLCAVKCVSCNMHMGGGWELFKVVTNFSHVDGSFNLFMANTGDVQVIIYFNLGLCAA